MKVEGNAMIRYRSFESRFFLCAAAAAVEILYSVIFCELKAAYCANKTREVRRCKEKSGM